MIIARVTTSELKVESLRVRQVVKWLGMVSKPICILWPDMTEDVTLSSSHPAPTTALRTLSKNISLCPSVPSILVLKVSPSSLFDSRVNFTYPLPLSDISWLRVSIMVVFPEDCPCKAWVVMMNMGR